MVVISNCESLDDWAVGNGTLSLDPVDFKEGAASIKNRGQGNGGGSYVDAVYDPAGTWDLSTLDHIVFWFKITSLNGLKLRVYSGADIDTDYVEWVLQFFQQVPAVNTWCRVKLYKDDFDGSSGSIDWGAVKALRIQAEALAAEWVDWRVDEILAMPYDPIKAKIGAAAGLDYVSDDVLELDIWGDDLRVGRWQMLLKNTDNKYGGRFHANEASDIEINTATMMKGYVDDVFPFLDARGYYTNNLNVMGRDYGRDLARLMYTAGYIVTKGDDIMEAILLAKSSEITYTSPSTAAIIPIERTRTYLIDWLQDIGGELNFSAYVNQAKALQFFAVGTVSSGIALKSLEGDQTNNIIHLLKGEEIGFSIANVVELSAGSLIDHYSDGNKADFTLGGGTAIANETTLKVAGTSSIKFYNVGAAKPAITLDFSGAGLYSHAGLDLSLGDRLSFWIRHNNSAERVLIKFILEDNAGKIIEFFRGDKGSTSDLGKTIDIPVNTWHKIQISYGDNITLATGPVKTDKWYNTSGSGFSWANVVKITWQAVQMLAGSEENLSATDLYLDALAIPTVEVISLIASQASIDAYGTSEWFEQRNDIKTQIELAMAAASELEKRKDPLKNIVVIATGQTGIKYPGLTVTVQAPKHGLTSPTTYRIVSYHHQYRKNPIKGAHSFITTLDLVSDDLSPATQLIDPRRYALNKDPVGAALEILALTRRRTRSAQTTQRKQYGATHPVLKVTEIDRGTAFPTDPDDGFLFWLTGDITGYLAATYEYDETANDWIRGPLVLHRNSDPPSGTEVLYDTLHRTDQDKWYRWTGAAWTLITFAATSVSGTLEASQLKKGIQPFDSAVLFEAIRAKATPANTWDIDVNNGAGKAEITGPNAIWSDAGFSVGDKIILQNAENPDHNTVARTVDALTATVMTLDSTLSGINNAHDEQMVISAMDAVKWTGASPGIWFADAGTQNISTSSGHGIAAGANWIIFTVASPNLTITNSYPAAVGNTVGILSRLEITSDSEPMIFPVMTRGGNMTLDFLGVGIVDTLTLTGEALIGKIMKSSAGVQWAAGGDPGVIITRDGIRGKGAAGALMVQMLASSGKFTAGGAVLDSSGLTLNTQALWFYDNSLFRGMMHAVWNEFADDLLVIDATDATLRMVSSLDVILGPGTHYVLPEDPLDKIGKNTNRWDQGWFDDLYGVHHIDRSNLAGRPAASSGNVGTFWLTREGTGTKEKLWVSMRNDANAYEWVQVGITT